MFRRWREALMAVIAVCGSYLLVAWLAWQVRNPTANSGTLFTYFVHVVTFDKLDEFQVSKR